MIYWFACIVLNIHCSYQIFIVHVFFSQKNLLQRYVISSLTFKYDSGTDADSEYLFP